MKKRFQIHEGEREEKVWISIVADQIVHHLTTMIGMEEVKIEKWTEYGGSSHTITQLGDIHLISSEICEEFIQNGVLEAETIQIDNTKVPIPKSLQKMKCENFHSSFLGEQTVKGWVDVLDDSNHLNSLKITENGVIHGLGRFPQVKNVKNELVICGCDISDEQLEELSDTGTLVLDSDKITEIGVRQKLEKWLKISPPSGNVFQIRFKPSSPNFDKNEIFEGIEGIEINWIQYFQFKLKSPYFKEELTGSYFTGEYHLIKIPIETEWKPNIKIGG